MGFFDDVKEDQTLQIQVLCVAFFLIAFPSYFMIKASATENPTGMGGVGSYTVTADFSYIDFASGEEPIQDGTPFTLDLNTDMLDDVDGKNIVGVLVSMSYGEDETGANGIQCNGPNSGQNAPDTISGMATHLNYSGSADGQNQGGSGSHDVSAVWYNSSVIGDKVEGLSESQINNELSKGIGLGDYSIEISVDANAGSGILGCDRSDTGESVTYTVQLIVLDYSISSYVELDGIDA